jgi:MFS family permease
VAYEQHNHIDCPSQIAHPSIRGRLTTLQQFMLGIGALIASLVGFGCFHGIPSTTSAQWRIPLALQLLPAIPLAFFIMLFPESPRYLAMKGRDGEALEALARLHAHGNVQDTFVRAEYEEILAAVRRDQLEGTAAIGDLFTNKSLFRRLVLGIALQFSVQMTGVSCLQYYSPQIFAS